ncbi:MAG: chemotaxis protein CheR, partial [Pseudomonadota bacterium]
MESHYISLSEKDFKRLGAFIQKECGIRMPNTKQQMLEARLQRRLRRLGMTGFDTYCDYLFSPEGMRAELTHMIDVVTTNKTEFFRESPHYDYLTQAVLPQLLEGSKI